MVELVHDLLESKGLDPLLDLLDSAVGISSVSHYAGLVVEVDQVEFVGHQGCVVLLEELLGDITQIHLLELYYYVQKLINLRIIGWPSLHQCIFAFISNVYYHQYSINTSSISSIRALAQVLCDFSLQFPFHVKCSLNFILLDQFEFEGLVLITVVNQRSECPQSYSVYGCDSPQSITLLIRILRFQRIGDQSPQIKLLYCKCHNTRNYQKFQWICEDSYEVFVSLIQLLLRKNEELRFLFFTRLRRCSCDLRFQFCVDFARLGTLLNMALIFHQRLIILNLLAGNNQIQQSSMSQTAKSSETSQKKPASWLLLIGETIVGCCAGFLVSPFNTIVDKSVVQYANGKTHLWTGVRNGLNQLFRSPQKFLTSFEFKWMLFVYTMTYASSNLADYAPAPDALGPALVKLGIVFAVNTTCSLIKDKAYVQHFATTPVRPFPAISLIFFFIRDLFAMASAFTLPPIFSKILSQKYQISERTALTIAQLSSPLLIQFFATPIHLIGMDFYNQPNLTLKERLKFIKSIYVNTLLLRMMRFLPAYGIGGIVNIELRGQLKKHLIQ